jgi:ABC-type sulfate transport system permease subunit
MTAGAARDELHSVTDWRAAALAGVIAGLVFLMLEMVLVWMVQGQSPWGPPHMIAAMVLGSEVLPSMGTWAPFDLKIVLSAMAIHFPMAIVYGLVGAWLMHRFDWVGAMMIGAALGLAAYIVNFYLIAPMAFPWFEMGRNWIGAFSHIMFGLTLGVAYIWLRKTNVSAR